MVQDRGLIWTLIYEAFHFQPPSALVSIKIPNFGESAVAMKLFLFLIFNILCQTIRHEINTL